MKEENAEETKEVLKFGKYHIYADRFQYILRRGAPIIGKDGKARVDRDASYHRTLADCLDSIYEEQMKEKVKGSGTLETTIERLSAFHADFIKKLTPLKKLEDSDNLR